MAINLNNFVDVSIQYHLKSQVSSTRDTAVLIIGGEKYSDVVYDSLTDFEADYEVGTRRYYYGYTFFANGGIKLRVIQCQTKKYDHTTYILTSSDSYGDFASTPFYLDDEGETRATPALLNLYKAQHILRTETKAVVGYQLVEESKEFINVSPRSLGYYVATAQEDGLYKFESGSYTKIVGEYSGTRYDIDLSIDSTFQPIQDNREQYVTASDQGDSYVVINRTLYYTIDTTATQDTTWATGVYYCTYDKVLPTPLSLNLYIASTYDDFRPVSFTDFRQKVASLTTEFIVIGTDLNYIQVNDVASQVNSTANLEETVINEKIFLACVTEEDLDSIPSDMIWANGMALKYGIEGVQMSMAAYLTRVNVDYYNSVQDYMFTAESVNYIFENYQGVSDTYGEYYDDDALYKRLNKLNINIDCYLENAVRNLGGNDMKGYNLINTYTLILLNQTLTERLVGLLVNKIKYNSTGLTMIGTTIAKELGRYVTNGFLSTDKSWVEDDLIYNGTTIISKNTPLRKGYKYVILPFSTLSDEDLRNHKLPTIYVLVADQYTIRKINIVGEVF